MVAQYGVIRLEVKKMAKKTIYINPGDMVDIRILEDPALEKNAKEWKWQIRPHNILIQVIDYNHVEYMKDTIYFDVAGRRKHLLHN